MRGVADKLLLMKLTISRIAIAQASLRNMTIVPKALNASAVGFSAPSSSMKYILIGCTEGRRGRRRNVRNESRCVAGRTSQTHVIHPHTRIYSFFAKAEDVPVERLAPPPQLAKENGGKPNHDNNDHEHAVQPKPYIGSGCCRFRFPSTFDCSYNAC